MDAGSLQGEREFQNELLFAGKVDSDKVLSVIGFSSDKKRRRMVLVYELMVNGSKIEEGKKIVVEDNGSVFEETESLGTTTVCEEFSGVPDQSPESFVTAPVAGTSPEMETGVHSPRMGAGDQDNGMSESGRVKDYVMEWIGSEIKKERPKSEWITAGASSSAVQTGKSEKKKSKKRLDWWMSLDEEKNVKKPKRRPAREWWKEEYYDEMYVDNRKKKRSRSRGSRGSVDWWLDGFSGELWRARHNSHDSVSGDIPKSSGMSSTPSMRGTVCYVAPEYSCGGDLSEKCDVYSFGVLLLVVIAGRRPLQVSGSPMSEFQRANLLSWTRHLARSGKLIDLVDQSIQDLDKEQALVCITVALLCLQKNPALRPSMKEIVAMLSGDLEPPPLPVEYSPSPPSRFRSHRKARLVS
ncbi:receptor-like serine/threonine-protein kinase [Artemisia annua]|uniref:Receptor-like serine/threonine-protein kinase n=1 Tax=Artemisia annua TaxID=35608 RepID=A0A2U1MLB6_ARTAN|nr:receptor-like serine/threonine-protein kinase [Artemisia annua]